MRYAIVCSEALMHQGKFQFTQWHDNEEDARIEAERLCMKEKKEFVLLQEIGSVKIQSFPMVWSGKN